MRRVGSPSAANTSSIVPARKPARTTATNCPWQLVRAPGLQARRVHRVAVADPGQRAGAVDLHLEFAVTFACVDGVAVLVDQFGGDVGQILAIGHQPAPVHAQLDRGRRPRRAQFPPPRRLAVPVADGEQATRRVRHAVVGFVFGMRADRQPAPAVRALSEKAQPGAARAPRIVASAVDDVQ